MTVNLRQVAAVLLFLVLPTVAVAQTRVDLRANQTLIKDQGGERNTCTAFATIAALEAAYRRAGYGALDLSEEFAAYMAKLNWLHPNWNNPADLATAIGPGGADRVENQYGYTGGGVDPMVLSQGIAIPTEDRMPYRSTFAAYWNVAGYPWDNRSQWTANTWNLDERNLPFAALTAPQSYRVTGFTTFAGNDPAVLEASLRANREVIWTFNVGGTRPAGIWHADRFAPVGSHAMLIVGYDRSSADPNQQYFMVKNSWAGGKYPGDNGFTRIGYDYVRAYGVTGAAITGVAAPRAWTEAQFYGRWTLRFDGFSGTLDITHLPGLNQAVFTQAGLAITDRRLGTFRDSMGVMHRVNGYVSGNDITFWFKSGEPNMRWDMRGEDLPVGRIFHYTMLPGRREMAGYHQDNVGDIPVVAYGGYARKDGALAPVFNNAQAWAPEQYLGVWRLQAEAESATFRCSARNDAAVPVAQRAAWAGVTCSYTRTGSAARAFTLLVARSDNAQVVIDVPGLLPSTYYTGRMLSWQRGVMAGDGFYAVRTGNP
ncbi:MAG: C1 family peptidase [Bradymonadia bacterium]|jgi:hypothetical protein